MKRWNRPLGGLSRWARERPQTPGPLCGALAGLWLTACTQIVGLDGSYAPAIDAPCQSSSDCASGVCTGSPGWCTESCGADTDCPSGVCVENSNGAHACFPVCETNADCGAYGVSELTCQPTTTIGGAAASICAT
jgi:hypothetical protein